MSDFHPIDQIEDCESILDEGQWPNFHDAELTTLNIWRGDVRPDDGVWIGPVIKASFELCALQHPYTVVLEFQDCEAIQLNSFNHQNAIYDLEFCLEPRGYMTDGTPLPPWIKVNFVQAFGANLSFKCMRIKALERRELD